MQREVLTLQFLPQQLLSVLRLKVTFVLHGPGDGHAQSGAEHQARVVGDGAAFWEIRHLHLRLQQSGAKATMQKLKAEIETGRFRRESHSQPAEGRM